MADNNDKNKIRRKKVSSSTNNTTSTTTKKAKKFKYLRAFSISLLILLVVFSAGGTGLVFASLRNVEPITKELLDSKTNERSEVLNSNGDRMYYTPSPIKKEFVSIDKIPEDLKNAVVSIEDERFYEHHGVDFRGLARAVVVNLFSSASPGGSTINMQVSKNLLTSTDKSIVRKIKDIYYAFEMDKSLTKDEVLELYLNNMGLGRGAVGVQAGAKVYFNKDVSELELHESAMLAGITKHPNKYSVYVPAKLDGGETKEDLENKLIFYTNTLDDTLDEPTDIELQMIDKIYDWGLIADYDTYTKLKNADMVVRKAVSNPDAKTRQETVLFKMHDLGYITDQEYKDALVAPINIELPPPEAKVVSYIEELVEKEAINSLIEQGHTPDEASNLYYNGGLKIYTTIDTSMQNIMEEEFKKGNNFPGSKIDKNGIPQPQAAMVIMDYRTGQIKALLGGRDVKGSKILNRATTPQQPGSTIKPLSIYTAAIDAGMTQSVVKSDVRGGYKYKQNRDWNPKTTTAGKEQMTLRKAVAKSSNPIAIKVAEDLGNSYDESVNVMLDYLNNFGISTVNELADANFAALTLGGMYKGITPVEMTAAYGALANGGVYVEPNIVTKIEDTNGDLLLQNTPEQHKVVDPEVAYVMTDMMTSVVDSSYGTGRRASLSSGMPVAGKTGTTNGTQRVWFSGYTPYYVASTFIGDDVSPREVSGGSGTAAALWSKVMNRIHNNMQVKDFSKPANITFARINLTDGGTVSYRGDNTDTAAFIQGTIPSRPSYVRPPVEETPEEEEKEEEKPQEEVTPDPTPPVVTPDPTPPVTPDPTPPVVTPDPTPPVNPDPTPPGGDEGVSPPAGNETDSNNNNNNNNSQ